MSQVSPPERDRHSRNERESPQHPHSSGGEKGSVLHQNSDKHLQDGAKILPAPVSLQEGEFNRTNSCSPFCSTEQKVQRYTAVPMPTSSCCVLNTSPAKGTWSWWPLEMQSGNGA